MTTQQSRLALEVQALKRGANGLWKELLSPLAGKEDLGLEEGDSVSTLRKKHLTGKNLVQRSTTRPMQQ